MVKKLGVYTFWFAFSHETQEIYYHAEVRVEHTLPYARTWHKIRSSQVVAVTYRGPAAHGAATVNNINMKHLLDKTTIAN